MLTKSHWISDGEHVKLSMPIAKVDRENRLVSGFATLDNVDRTDDVVTAEASKTAFAAFRGNIREMHQPIAAGRIVDFSEQEFYHDGKFYRGIYVTAYVSKGAQDTWEKVLDGTLSGFSIGGNVTESNSEFVKEAGADGKVIRYITKYDLIELSLVDSPANQLSNVDAVTKSVFTIKENSDGDLVMKGMVANTSIVNVFWCNKDEIAKNSESESENCLACGNAMQQIGWFETGEDAVTKTASVVQKFLSSEADEEPNNEGGVNMADNENESVETGVVTSSDVTDLDEKREEDGPISVDETAEVPEEVQPGGEVAVEAEEKETEQENSDQDFEKMFDNLKDSVNKSLEASKESVEKAVESVEARVVEITKSLEDQASEFKKSLGELDSRLESIKTDRESVTKRLDALEKATAIKKSGEVETTETVKTEKGLWAGAFFKE